MFEDCCLIELMLCGLCWFGVGLMGVVCEWMVVICECLVVFLM